MSALKLTIRAERDLGEIFAEMAHEFRFFGEETARHYCDGLKEELEQLSRQPMNGRAEPAIDDRTRSLPFRRHTIYYEIDGDGIIVLRVLAESVSA
ncbi:type II toxin-antitoxin system RelE/ParE family toxin [Sandaracinobacteroides hominis]|uniref:type II toxin-antitoxin system RelE/ParE family toxin n=1 Tax=Sandaracinobacteroides hominis TaxID=2780086 RepID=UPI0018F67303|nr:type II toxin-antitoxin system RelE/ParE family toxin [Sandaracinobacteroides hominis]